MWSGHGRRRRRSKPKPRIESIWQSDHRGAITARVTFYSEIYSRRSREIAHDDPVKLNAWLDKAARQTGLKREAVGDVVFALKERLHPLDAGKTTGPQIVIYHLKCRHR